MACMHMHGDNVLAGLFLLPVRPAPNHGSCCKSQQIALGSIDKLSGQPQFRQRIMLMLFRRLAAAVQAEWGSPLSLAVRMDFGLVVADNQLRMGLADCGYLGLLHQRIGSHFPHLQHKDLSVMSHFCCVWGCAILPFVPSPELV